MMYGMSTGTNLYKFRIDLASATLLATQTGIALFLAWWLLDLAGLAVVFLAMLVPFGPLATGSRPLGRPLDAYSAPGLSRLVAHLSDRAGLGELPEIRFLPTPLINAAASRAQGRSQILVTDGLMRSLDGPELAGVLAHEVSHLKHRDLASFRWIMAMQALVLAIGLTTLLLLGPHPALALALLLAVPFMRFLAAAHSRLREYAADLGAAELTGDPAALARALYRIEYRPRNFWEVLTGVRPRPVSGQEESAFRSHPPTPERIRRLLALAQRNIVPGDAGTPRWRGGPAWGLRRMAS